MKLKFDFFFQKNRLSADFEVGRVARFWKRPKLDRLREKKNKKTFQVSFCIRLKRSRCLRIILTVAIFNSCFFVVAAEQLKISLQGFSWERKLGVSEEAPFWNMLFFLANVDLLCVVMQLIYEGDKIYSGLFIFLSSSDDSDDNDDDVDVDRKSIFFFERVNRLSDEKWISRQACLEWIRSTEDGLDSETSRLSWSRSSPTSSGSNGLMALPSSRPRDIWA